MKPHMRCEKKKLLAKIGLKLAVDRKRPAETTMD